MPQIKQSTRILPDEPRRASKSSVALTASNASVQDISSHGANNLVGYASSTNYKSFTTQNSSAKSASQSKQHLSDIARTNQTKYKSCLSKALCYWPQQMVLCTFKTPLLCKLLMLIIVPITAMVAIGAVYIAENTIAVSHRSLVSDSVQISNTLSELLYSAAAERTASILYISANGTDFVTERFEYMQTTSDVIEEVIPKLSRLKENTNTDRGIRTIEECQEELQTIDHLRGNVSQLSYSRSRVFKAYTKIISTCINVIDTSVRSLKVAELSENILSFRIFLNFIESFGQVQSQAVGVIRSDQFQSNQEYIETTRLIVSKDTAFSTFLDIATPSQRDIWREFVENDDLYAAMKDVFDTLIHTPDGTLGYDWRAFIDNSTQMMTKYESLRSDLIVSIRSHQDELSSEATTVLIIVCCAIFVVISFALFTIFSCSYCVYKPWRMLMKKREDIMDLALDCADAIARLDFDRESVKQILRTTDENCTLLELAFKRIITNFQEFSDFLPQTLIAAVKAAGEEENETPQPEQPMNTKDKEKQPVKSAQSVKSNTNTLTANSNSTYSKKEMSSRRYRSTVNTTNTGSSGDMVKIRMNYGLTYREVSVLVIDIQNMHGTLSACDSNGICTLHADMLNAFSDIISQSRGIVHSFVGDKIVASWNSVNSVMDREALACRAALKCNKELTTKLHQHWKTQRLPPIECSFSIVSGGVYCGNIGTNGQKGYAQFAPVMSRVWTQAKLVKKYGVDSSILIDDATFQKVSMKFLTRIIDAVQYDCVKHTSEFGVEKLYTLVSQKSMDDDEWLYELDELEAQDEQGADTLIEAFDYLIREDFSAAKECLDTYKKEAEECLEDNIETVERLENYLENGISITSNVV